jgi:hypothetical protein
MTLKLDLWALYNVLDQNRHMFFSDSIVFRKSQFEKQDRISHKTLVKQKYGFVVLWLTKKVPTI